MSLNWRKRVTVATVTLPEAGGEGVLVPGAFVLTAAHALPWDGRGRMALGDDCLVMVKPKMGATFRLRVCAVEPVADIAVLGEPDNQVFDDDATAFEEFVAATQPVQVYGEEFGADVRVPVHVLTHRGSWLDGEVREAADGCAWVVPQAQIEGGTSGAPVVRGDGQLVGLISHTLEEPPFGGRLPRPHRALPGWVWNQVDAAQRRSERR